MKKIIVVDDDEGILDALDIMLTNEGYIVETSFNGDVLEHIQAENFPDLVLLDMLLSGKDGIELCRNIKDNEETKDIPVLMFSAHPNAKKAIATCGADGFLAKPFNMQDLLTEVEKYTN